MKAAGLGRYECTEIVAHVCNELQKRNAQDFVVDVDDGAQVTGMDNRADGGDIFSDGEYAQWIWGGRYF